MARLRRNLEDDMATATVATCPHCNSALTYLEGVTGGTLNPVCPRCRQVVKVATPTLLAAYVARPGP